MNRLEGTRHRFLIGSAAALLPAAAPGPIRPAARGRVKVLDPDCHRYAALNARYLEALEPDRLLHTFRLNAGLRSRAVPLGGWERPDCEVRGHFLGHFLSACALMFATEGNSVLRERAGLLVGELAKCQRANGGGYLSAFPPSFFERLKAGTRVWAPWYTIHKILAGLLDVHTCCQNEQALEVLEGMAGWTARWARALPPEPMARTLDVEHGGMMELLLNLHALTRKAEYLDAALRFEHRRILDPLAAGRDELKGVHANTTIPKITGAARAFEITGEARYRDAAEFFWRQVTALRSYVTGGTSNFEHWRTAPGGLAGELSARTQECCCTYNMLKLTRHLFCWSAGPRYADYFERAHLNGILGTMNPEDGMTMYFVPLAPGYWKLYGLPLDSFWCCTGTGVESFAALGDGIYFHSDRDLYVNRFTASELDWPEMGARLKQVTEFPSRESVALEVEVKAPVEFALHIRIPSWVAESPEIRVNGERQPAAKPGSYAAIRRRWRSGDRVGFTLPMSVRAESLPGGEAFQAFLYGPLVLAGRLGRQGLTREMMYGSPNTADWPQAIRGDPVPAPDLPPGARPEPVKGQALTFRAGGVTLVPLNRLFGERYAVYWRMRRGA
ncbi:MAG: glycoside hydrolase family 127 protein [Bryobacterales bacterium]|nr:glycoside hydrolase family 127 protein [Bryobacterales bacterium]